MTINFIVPGVPVSYKRNNHNFKERRTFLPQNYRNYRKIVQLIAKSVMQGQPCSVKPISAVIKVFHPVKAASKQSGDIDNHAKSILDSLNGVVFKDDGQIVQAMVYKFKDKDNPRVEVFITDEF